MKLKQLLKLIDGTALTPYDENQEFNYVFASDLMSDVLALVQKDSDQTVLVTGLCNAQSLRTADMLDMGTILYVRDKHVHDEDLQLAESMGLTLLATRCTMYETCGLLYEQGLKPVEKA